jgi:hypothetical protein
LGIRKLVARKLNDLTADCGRQREKNQKSFRKVRVNPVHANISRIPYLEGLVKEAVFVIETAIERLGIKHHHILNL